MLTRFNAVLPASYSAGSRLGTVSLNAGGSYVGTPSSLHTYEASYTLGGHSISSVAMVARKTSIDAAFFDGSAADELRRYAASDVAAEQPGTITLGDWSQRAYIVSMELSKARAAGAVYKLGIVLLDGVWHRASNYHFAPSASSSDASLDLPYDAGYDLLVPPALASVTASMWASSPCRLTVYGAATSPFVIVGANRYQVDVTVPAGSRLELDGLSKTCMLISAQGDVQDVFAKAKRGRGAGCGTYAFERIPAGLQSVSWDNSFSFDLTVYEEEAEPAWIS